MKQIKFGQVVQVFLVLLGIFFAFLGSLMLIVFNSIDSNQKNLIKDVQDLGQSVVVIVESVKTVTDNQRDQETRIRKLESRKNF